MKSPMQAVRFASLLRRKGSLSGFVSRRHCTNSALEKRISTIPWQYLRAMDPKNFDAKTRQRNNVNFNVQDGKPILDIPPEPRVKIVTCSLNNWQYQVAWTDGTTSHYSRDWVDSLTQSKKQTSNRILWTDLTEEDVRKSSRTCLSFPDVIANEEAALHAIFRYGFVLITGTPITDDGVAALASALGGGSVKSKQTLVGQYRKGSRKAIGLSKGTDGPLRTLYGTVWSTSSSGQAPGASLADSSFGSEGLPLHTDLTYYGSPPGLQIFTMVQPAASGGATILADGFAAATQLRQRDAGAFDLLSRTVRRYRCVDSRTGWHLEASGPVIQRSEEEDIVMIRHNDLDRLPELPPTWFPRSADDFYKEMHVAHAAWDRILADDRTRLVLQLQPGDTLVVANQRCLHGRFGFKASDELPRVVMGCYVGQDELSSRFRLLGYNVF